MVNRIRRGIQTNGIVLFLLRFGISLNRYHTDLYDENRPGEAYNINNTGVNMFKKSCLRETHQCLGGTGAWSAGR